MMHPEDAERMARLREDIAQHAAEIDRTARELAATPLAPWAAFLHVCAAGWRAIGERIGR